MFVVVTESCTDKCLVVCCSYRVLFRHVVVTESFPERFKEEVDPSFSLAT
jgi:hypothetical protein